MFFKKLLILPLFFAATLAKSETKKDPERLIFETKYGMLVFALYPEVAPLHVAQIKKIARAGGYTLSEVVKTTDNSLLQFSNVEIDRPLPISARLKSQIRRLPLELSNTQKHQWGKLSMVRNYDQNSATSAFSIILGPAKHLDGQFTIFGQLEAEFSIEAVLRIMSLKRKNDRPIERVYVTNSYLESDLDIIEKKATKAAILGEIFLASKEDRAQFRKDNPQTSGPLILLLSAIIALSVIAFFQFHSIGQKVVISILMMHALIAVFGILILIIPYTHESAFLAAVVFLGLIAMFKFLTGFEKE